MENKRLQDVAKAEIIIIQLLQPSNIKKWMRLEWKNEDEIKQILSSIARRAKYGFFLWKVLAEGHIGTLPPEVVWEGRQLSWEQDYQVTSTIPTGDVQVTPRTKIVCNLE